MSHGVLQSPVVASSFSLATWNILATSYIRAKFYPGTPPSVLDPEWRIPAIVRHATGLGVDILCLQEVERPVFAALAAGLAESGYAGTFAPKDGGKPDGCAAFLRTSICELLTARRIVYADSLDGAADSGHIGQLLLLNVSGMKVALVNTHFKWDPPQTPAERQVGLRQAKLALAALQQEESSSIQMICGDFNATPDSDLVECLIQAGFDYTHRSCANAFTCNSNRKAKLIDYVFFRGAARAEPEPLLPIDGLTPLPSVEQPSDHLPLIARIYVDR